MIPKIVKRCDQQGKLSRRKEDIGTASEMEKKRDWLAVEATESERGGNLKA